MKFLTKKLTSIQRAVVLGLFSMTMVGCSSLPFMNDEPDYKGAGRSKPLEIPPDLTASPVSEAYALPGGTTYSSYSESQTEVPGEIQVLADPKNVKMEKSGGLRWLVVNASAEAVWPVIRDFWNEQGFAVRSEDPAIGVMETQWIKSEKIKKNETGGYGDRFDRWLDGLSGVSDRKKFRTRIERGEKEGTTEIYMTHRSVTGAPDDGKNRIQTQLGEIETGYRRDADKKKVEDAEYSAELDAELLRRLMVKFGIEEQKAQAIAANPVVQKRVEIIKDADGSATLKVIDPYDRAWRRVGLAIDRVGFVMEDKDRSNGLFFVRYANLDIDTKPQKKKGLLETLKFWGDDDEDALPETDRETSLVDSLKFWGEDDGNEQEEGQYRIKLTDNGDNTSSVNVVNVQGDVVRTKTANRILGLIYAQLR